MQLLTKENVDLLRSLNVHCPKAQIQKIQDSKDMVDQEVSNWILHVDEYLAFSNWDQDDGGRKSCRQLCLTGSAGSGKTMLLMSLIQNPKGLQCSTPIHVSHFFFQAREEGLNSAEVALRSLLFQLFEQQPHLISTLRGRRTRLDSFYTVAKILKEALPNLRSRVCFIVDALDECKREVPGPDELLHFISESLDSSKKIRWLVSSREDISPDDRYLIRHRSGMLLKIGHQQLKGPVRSYIDSKRKQLDNRGYAPETIDEVTHEAKLRSNDNFLWVSLVFKELERLPESFALDTIKQMPRGLEELYSHLMDNVYRQNEAISVPCRHALGAICLAYRPLSFSELSTYLKLPEKAKTEQVVRACGSFLVTRGEEIFTIHHSAREYLEKEFTSRFWESGSAEGHARMFEYSVSAMSILDNEPCDLNTFDAIKEGRKKANLLSQKGIRYPFQFWLNHLSQSQTLAKNQMALQTLKERFLRWLRVISLAGDIRDASRSLKDSLHTLKVRCGG